MLKGYSCKCCRLLAIAAACWLHSFPCIKALVPVAVVHFWKSAAASGATTSVRHSMCLTARRSHGASGSASHLLACTHDSQALHRQVSVCKGAQTFGTFGNSLQAAESPAAATSCTFESSHIFLPAGLVLLQELLVVLPLALT